MHVIMSFVDCIALGHFYVNFVPAKTNVRNVMVLLMGRFSYHASIYCAWNVSKNWNSWKIRNVLMKSAKKSFQMIFAQQLWNRRSKLAIFYVALYAFCFASLTASVNFCRHFTTRWGFRGSLLILIVPGELNVSKFSLKYVFKKTSYRL